MAGGPGSEPQVQTVPLEPSASTCWDPTDTFTSVDTAAKEGGVAMDTAMEERSAAPERRATIRRKDTRFIWPI